MQITENFKLEELIKSYTAERLGIDNKPKAIPIVNNLKGLTINCLQPIRSYFNKPLIITSGYRCPKLNQAIGGTRKSQHTKGEAADFIVKDTEIKAVIEYIRNNIEFDQLIEENNGQNKWIHISYKKEGNRKEVLKYEKGVYSKYE